MQTIPVRPINQRNQLDQQLAMQSSHPLPQTRSQTIPLPMVAPPAPGMDPQRSKAAATAAEINPYAELDAMLIRDPNVGAIHGLRTALLFNAGLALSGLVIWEVWSLLAL